MSLNYLNQLAPVYLTYLIATASPGPSNMAIMGVAMGQGRKAALALAFGVLTGSMFWAVLAATGIAALLAAYATALFAIKIAGALYLLYLAYKSGRAALSPDHSRSQPAQIPAGSLAQYRRGLLLHLTNPKAVLAWIAIMSLGLRAGSSPVSLQAIIFGCAGLGVMVFGGYALLFSISPMVRAYHKARRWIEGVLAAFFGFAGLRLMLSRT